MKIVCIGAPRAHILPLVGPLALLKNMFGEEQMSALADYISAALMLRYTCNQRERGWLMRAHGLAARGGRCMYAS